MKHIKLFSFLLLSLTLLWGCKKESSNYPGGTLSPFIALFDLRNLDKGQDVTLTKDALFGASQITGLVVSDHSGGNMPAGMLVVQDHRRLSLLRGIAISIGDAAASYVPGDSVVINVEGAVLKRVNGILQLTGVTNEKITKVSSGAKVVPVIVKNSDVLNAPGTYESTLITVNKGGFDPSYPAGTTYAGDRIMNDGFGNLTLHTEQGANYANKPLPYMSNNTGIVFGGADGKPQLWPRGNSDILVTAATAPKIANIIITGYLTDPSGTDGGYEYIQLMATKNLDFAATPYALVTSNNAGSNGYPAEGWATGGARTYKINITTGTVQKGQYFYVGANKKIWGSISADVTSALWISKPYQTDAGDGFGAATSNLLANSGNVASIAVFDKTDVTSQTEPIDVIFYGSNGGQVFTAGPPPLGYRITNTDLYDLKNPSTQADQPFFNQGSNTSRFAFPTTSNFSQLGGKYNKTTGRWTTARALKSVVLTNSSTVSQIEGATSIEE